MCGGEFFNLGLNDIIKKILLKSNDKHIGVYFRKPITSDLNEIL